MPAVVTDQFRIANAGNFVDSVLNTDNSYYVFLGLPNPATAGFGRTTSWNSATPSPIDNLEYLTHYRDTSLFGKKITSANIRRVVKKNQWVANTKYDMYRHDYRVAAGSDSGNPAPNSKSGRLYNTNYYVVTSEFKVYICLDNGGIGPVKDANGVDQSAAKGADSLDEPTFTDLEPAAAGTQDPYVWKYLFTISPSDVIKFDSTEYIVLPSDWSTTTDPQIQPVREAGNSDINKNQIKTVYVENQGSGYGSTREVSCEILGDGSGAKALVKVENGKISDVIVTQGGSGYTFAMVDLSNLGSVSVENRANLIPIIPPSKGHGFDIYTELGADKVLVYSRFDDSTKDFPSDTHFGQVGILKNPQAFGSSGILTTSQFSSSSAIKLQTSISIADYDNLIGAGITQLRSDGGIARGTVVSYDQDTFVLKYIQDRSLNLNQTTFDTTSYQGENQRAQVLSFESNNNAIKSGTIGALIIDNQVDTGFTGFSTDVGSRNINLGIQFTNGLANPEINKKTGDVIYIDNREEVTRNTRQKEDVKIILEF